MVDSRFFVCKAKDIDSVIITYHRFRQSQTCSLPHFPMTYSLIAAATAPADALNIGSELLSKQWGGSLEARKAQLLQKNFSWLLVESADHNNVLGHVKLTPAVQTNSDVYGTAPSGVLTSVVISETHRGQGVGGQSNE